VTLEFTKVVDQVQKMGRYLGKRDQSMPTELALERYYQLTDLDPVHERIKLVRESSVSGYRRCPAPRPYDEIMVAWFRCPKPPSPPSSPMARRFILTRTPLHFISD
jgi:hypothetical protein